MALAIFDLDDTLVDREAAFRRWAIDFAREHGLDAKDAVPWLEEADEGGARPKPAFFALARALFHIDAPLDALLHAWKPAYLRHYAVAKKQSPL